MARGAFCRIHNKSDSTIKMIPKSYPDGAAASRGMIRKKLVREIPPNGFIDVDCRKYDLNEINCNVQIKIHFVATNGGRVRLEQLQDDVYPNGVEVANLEPVFLHYELKAMGQIYLACGEEEEVKADESS